MSSSKMLVAARVLLTAIGTVLVACAPATDNSAVEADPVAAEPAAPLYISRKQVSTDCGVAATPNPIPGFADRPNEEVLDMPPPIAGALAVGADRPIAETDHERVSPGYVMIEPIFVGPTILVNNDKEVVATFENDYFSSFTQLQDDGTRLVNAYIWNEVFQDGGGNRGCLEEYAADGRLNWRLMLSTPDYIQHHDVVKLPNGNLLTIVWERVSAEHAIELGRNPEHVAEDGDFWYDGVIEINPKTAEIVWEWSMRYHMIQDFNPAKPNYGVVADHPGKLDINSVNFNQQGQVDGGDWTHFNAIDYNPDLGHIILSSPSMSEVYIIDHGTTPYESRGPKGDLLYRWGRPSNYDRGTEEDRRLHGQHDVQWIRPGLDGAGEILIFNNGDQLRPYTTVVQFAPEMNDDGSYVLNDGEAYGPEELTWEYNPPEEEQFMSFFISGAQRLPNGNTLVNQGAGAKVREVTADGDIVWEYKFENETDAPHTLFRAYRYAEDHPAVKAILEQAKQ